ncbi:MAB_1171c family putative transporter, partial [Streptomyces clavuligerus]
MKALTGYLPAVVALGVGWYELLLARDRRQERAVRLLCLFALFLATSMAVLAPATMDAVDRALPRHSELAHLLGRELEMAALALLPAVVGRLAPRGPWEARQRTHLAVSAAVLTAAPVLFLLSGADLTAGRIVADGRGGYALAGFGLLFAAFSLWCLWGLAARVHRHARTLPPGPLRTGLRLIVAGAATGALWALWGLTGVANVLLHQGQGAGQDPVALLLGTACLLISASGVTAARWAPAASAVRRWRRCVRGYRALEPLWSPLAEAVPRNAPTAPPGRVMLLRDAELALYRRVIEIRDGYLELRPYLPPGFADWAEDGFRRHPVAPPSEAAATEAAAVGAALEYLRSGRRPSAPGT